MPELALKSKASGLILLAVLLVGALGLSGFYYHRYKQVLSTNSTVQTKQITDYLSRFVQLPNEQPSLATVLDKTKLTNPTLAQKAENGDKMLIYAKAQRLFLYRPSIKKLVDVLLIQNGNNLGATSQSTQVALLNGTANRTLSVSIANKLAKKVAKITINRQIDAKRTDYAKTVVVDPSGNFSAQAKEIAATLNASIGTLPSDEAQPAGSDIVIILGKDSQ